MLTQQYRTSVNLEARIQLHERFSADRYDFVTWAFDQLSVPPSCSILEVGCGTGQLWARNKERCPCSWDVTLSDLSPGMVSKARTTLGGPGRAFRFVPCDAQQLPFIAERFDAVIANHMLYHMADLDQALAEIRRVLRTGGKLYAATNGVHHMAELDAIVPDYIPHAPMGKSIAGFTLQNGPASLARFFGAVEVRQHSSPLLVTEAMPLVEYCLSRPTAQARRDDIDEVKRADFVRHVERTLRESGGTIRIGREVGMLVATKGRDDEAEHTVQRGSGVWLHGGASAR
jgi:SAM-dependent methyltransferase